MPAARQPKRIGIVGCGAVARQFHASAIKAFPHLRPVGVSDLNPDLARDLGAQLGCPAMPYAALLENTDFVAITTPPASHYSLVKTALDAGVHVIVEKPFVARVAEAIDLIERATKAGRGLFVAQLRRFASAPTLARQLVEAGAVGTVTGLEVYEGGRFSWDTASGYVHKDRHGGVIFDTGSQSLDLGLFVTGLDSQPMSITLETVVKDKPEPAHEVRADFLLHGNLGQVTARLVLSRYEPLANLIRVRGDRGQLELGIGFGDTVRLKTSAGRVLVRPPGPPRTFHQCFAAQYASILEAPATSPTRAQLVVNQIMILEQVHAHA